MSYIDDEIAQLKVFEGVVPHMYLDTKGNVTVGVGRMLPNAASACALPFVKLGLGGTLQRATADEITEDFDRVKAMQPGMLAVRYEWAGSCVLPEEAVDSLLRSVLQETDAQLPSVFPKYSTWPAPAKLAVLDMAYNLGMGGLRTYHQLIRALTLNPPRFDLAEGMCGRDVHESAFVRRNAWTEYQFSLAAKAQA